MRAIRVVVLLLITLSLSCVTVNVYFPEAEIRDLSRQIEEEIRQRAAEAAAEQANAEAQDADSQQSARVEPGALLELVGAALFGSRVHAQDRVPQPEVTNPAIRRIIDGRAKRLAAVNDFKAAGAVGENNKALLEIRALDAVSELRQRATLQRVVKDENADREQLFKEIAAATSVAPSQIPRIRQTYAATIRDEARVGNWIQMPDGEWRQK